MHGKVGLINLNVTGLYKMHVIKIIEAVLATQMVDALYNNWCQACLKIS